jgi:hypothetical protein
MNEGTTGSFAAVQPGRNQFVAHEDPFVGGETAAGAGGDRCVTPTLGRWLAKRGSRVIADTSAPSQPARQPAADAPRSPVYEAIQDMCQRDYRT